MIKKLLLPFIFLGILSLSSVYAQLGDIGNVLRAGAEDAELITRAYLEPIPSGMGSNINSGWTNRAETHSTLGFDLQIRVAGSFIPDADQSFNLNDLDLQKITPADPSSTISPTVGGDNNVGPEVIVRDEGEELTRFQLPEGSGISIVPAPMVQAGVGLIKDTDLIARFVPKITIDDTQFNMVGFGLKHGINQWLPAGKFLPVNLSLIAGFTNINLNTDFDLQPEPGAIPNPDNPEAVAANFDNQEGDVSLNTFTVKALVGKDLPFISLFGGVGYETSTMDVDITGNYPVSASFEGAKAYDVVTDPFTYNADGKNDFSLLGGVTLKLAFFNIFGEFTLSEYSSVNAGIGFSFR